MKLITQFELATMSVPEIRKLQHKVGQELATTLHGSRERLNGHASLLNIKRELAMRSPCP